MEKVELNIITLSHSMTHSHNYAIVLGEIEGSRKLPIVIGGYEAQAIAVMMERMIPNRPLTHDLFHNVLDAFDIKLKEVIINNLVDGVFYSLLICEQNGKELKIDSRTSDAIALAVRTKCKIYTYGFVLETAGVVLEEEGDSNPTVVDQEEDNETKSKESRLSNYNLKMLKKLLDDALKDEQYEKAAKIRDEISRRESN